MTEDKLRVAVIGCGAIAEQQHIPSLQRRSDCELVALVDASQERATHLAERFSVPRTYTDWEALSSAVVDAAVVALPNNLHMPASVALLERGIHVLVEKPMALSVSECDQVLAAAGRSHATVAIGHVRRFSHASRFAKRAIENGVLGDTLTFDIQDGFVFRWPSYSDYLIRKEKCGGGVLMDLGSHTLDQLMWWLGEVDSLEYFDDSFGGLEADCRINLTMECGASGTVELSRTRNLPGTAVIRGEKAELEVSLVRNTASLRLRDSEYVLNGAVGVEGLPGSAEQRAVDLIGLQLDDFFAAIRCRREPLVSGDDARRAVALIERCYSNRQALSFPWLNASTENGSR